MTKRILIIVSIVSLAWFIAAPAWATPSGCANTYTTDVTAEGNTILYLFGDWGNNKYDDGHYFGISYGVGDWMEIGGTYRLTLDSDFQSDPVFDLRLRHGLSDEEECEGADSGWGHPGAVAFGLDNITGNEDENGSMIPYIAYTNLWCEGVRGHAGYSFEDGNNSIFIGFDAEAGDATLLADWMQTNDGGDWVAAFGVAFPLEIFDTEFGGCTFLSIPSDDAESETIYLELAYEFD